MQLAQLRAAVDALEAQLTANLAGARDAAHALAVHGHAPHGGPAVVHTKPAPVDAVKVGEPTEAGDPR